MILFLYNSIIFLIIFEGEIPWQKYGAEKIKKKLVHEAESLPVDTSRIPEKYHGILQYGLQRDPLHRLLNFSNVHQILQLSDQVIKEVKALNIELFTITYYNFDEYCMALSNLFKFDTI